jgi:hypothetical protein
MPLLAKIFAQCRNADGLPVFAIFNKKILQRLHGGDEALMRLCACATKRAQRNSPHEKFFRGKCRYGRVERLSAAQNARIGAK